MKKFLMIVMMVLVVSTLTGCFSDSDVASSNISKEADQFKVRRRIVFYNSIQDVYILEMTGNCSIEVDEIDSMLEVTCKIGEDKYQKHFLGLSDNVTYTVEQLEYSNVSEYKYDIVFKPESIVPVSFDLE